MIIRWHLVFGIISVLLSCLIAPLNALASKEGKNATNTNCPMLTECPFRAEFCVDDDDCPVDSICCKSPCGKVCTKQLSTGCETLRKATARRAKSLGMNEKSVRMPRCNKSGGFEQIQCDNEIVSSCWCVDEIGFEVPGTRAPAAALVNCTARKSCAEHTCRMFCPHGFALTKDGCPLCKCRDPCDDIKCPNQLECQFEDLTCADPPCPPIPTCKRGRSLANICPVGEPLRISDTVRPFLCGNDPGKPTCPPLYQCLVQKGNDYGVCCPASLQIQKTGNCPATNHTVAECGNLCTHDLECPSLQKCCKVDQCGGGTASTCVHPANVTECLHQRTLAEVLTVSERSGRGYVPQCTPEGDFERRQCSRNGLVCWCVDKLGRKIRGSMSAAENVNCSSINNEDMTESNVLIGRNLRMNSGCENNLQECAQICEYGFKVDENGCHTCKCDDPCDGYMCPEDEECVNVREANCADFLCPTLPVCRPKAVYTNPCPKAGTPLTDDLSGAPVACALRSEEGTVCPSNYECLAVPGSTQAVCCPKLDELESADNEDQLDMQASEDYSEARPQSMCEYLHEFSDSMEGTREGMNIALPQPECDKEGNYLPMQCHNGDCWCVDQFGTEIPKTRQTTNQSNETMDCAKLRQSLDCLDLTCRMGCEYGFALSEETGCPLCQCRDPCSGITCPRDQQCQLVEVSCTDHYCPPVPACLPKKVGQCPYLVPAAAPTCDFECNSDAACNETMRCCSNGCGTQCVEPLMLTACQHQRTVAQYQATESAIPAGKVYIPQCMDDEDGRYAAKQCHPASGECWCVDQQGFEISQTRTRNAGLVCEDNYIDNNDDNNNKQIDQQSNNCTSTTNDCDQVCDHGYEMDENNCRTCNCIDPCKRLNCRSEEGETCRLVAVECTDWPCPPVPMCLPKKDNPCQNGDPLKVGDELVTCGPDFESCPSTHKCQLSPVGEYAVCCPKPRDVCFEPLDRGRCNNSSDSTTNYKQTRYHFNARTNKCEPFSFEGCRGNHNNFHSLEMCQTTCPVLSQCERLKEKNLQMAQRYRKQTFIPRCDGLTGAWQPVQCLEHVGVCWCVNPLGEPLKGTLIRGAQPQCNFRQARNRVTDRLDDLVLEQLMMEISNFHLDEEEHEDDVEQEIPKKFDARMDMTYVENNDLKNSEEVIKIAHRCPSLGGQCDEAGKFLPTQCEQEVCWCVDEAGNQLANTNTFPKGERICSPTPVESVEVTLGFRGENINSDSIVHVVNQITKLVTNNLNGHVNNDEGIKAETEPNAFLVKFTLIGSNKVDVAYTLEQLVMKQQLPVSTSGLSADIAKSRVVHKLFSVPVENNSKFEENLIYSASSANTFKENREIVSQSPVSVVAPYHTAMIVIAAASAFVISVLTLLVILYRRKMAAIKHVEENNGFFAVNSRPIYIELPNEKFTKISSVESK